MTSERFQGSTLHSNAPRTPDSKALEQGQTPQDNPICVRDFVQLYNKTHLPIYPHNAVRAIVLTLLRLNFYCGYKCSCHIDNKRRVFENSKCKHSQMSRNINLPSDFWNHFQEERLI